MENAETFCQIFEQVSPGVTLLISSLSHLPGPYLIGISQFPDPGPGLLQSDLPGTRK